jgi:hypothetical protein
VNRAIRVPEVRVVNEESQQLGVMPTDAARDIASRVGLDLVEISPNGTLCLRLQRGCGVRGWGDGLGAARRGGGARARRALIVAFALTSLSPQSDTAQG